MSDLKADLAALRIERGPERRAGRWVGWLVVIVLLAVAAVAAWRWYTRPRPFEVDVVSAVERSAGEPAKVLDGSGYVTARRRATVSSKVTGKVVEINVEEGMAVREGQVLARLDDTNVRAALALAEAQAEAARRAVAENEVRLAEARVNLRRRQQLLKDGVATPAELDQVQAEVDSYDARVAAARQQVQVAERQIAVQQTDLDNTVIRAPFNGVAISKDAQPGEMVSPISAGGGFTRTGICTIVDMRSLEIEVDVNEAYIGRVSPRQPATAVLNAYPDWQIPAHVITTVPTADRQKATVLVRLAFESLDARVLPDMGVKVSFLRKAPPAGKTPAADTPGQPVVVVPAWAVRQEGDQSVVFVVNGQAVERRGVRLGSRDGDRAEVIAGLRSGEQVVTPIPAGLANGSQIAIK